MISNVIATNDFLAETLRFKNPFLKRDPRPFLGPKCQSFHKVALHPGLRSFEKSRFKSLPEGRSTVKNLDEIISII